MNRFRIEICGLVQGVGFRPFIYCLAFEHNLVGFVCNTKQGVLIEAQGVDQDVFSFMKKIQDQPPAPARIHHVKASKISLLNEASFQIRHSDHRGPAQAVMPHDRAPCRRCLDELSDPKNRRFRFPFITCNECGPRFTITEALPFDRDNTTMRQFTLCKLCHLEFTDPTDRRFHAQTISCPNCGPRLIYQGRTSATSTNADALTKAIATLNDGGLIAVKGVGGYQLICLATAKDSLSRIRHYKERKLKPFAVLAPSIIEVMSVCQTSPNEAELLCSPVAPVVILYTKPSQTLGRKISANVAPKLATLGVMLPSTPLHHLLIAETKRWLVITSANRRGEPIYTDDIEAIGALSDVVDGILYHNRIIAHLADDSVLRDADGQSIILRHARGLAPSEIVYPTSGTTSDAIGMGGHMKSAFALAIKDRCILSQHIGDLDSKRSCDVFRKELNLFESIYNFDANFGLTCHDHHPCYKSTILAEERQGHLESIFHHEAHLEALIAEHDLTTRAIGIVCDGSGLGVDGSIRGGEFFLIDRMEREHIGSLLPFRLPGGERAIKEPKRSAFGMLYETYQSNLEDDPFILKTFTQTERTLVASLLKKKINAPYTTSLGRLFDGLTALLGICIVSDYEAQAPMALEALAHASLPEPSFPVHWKKDVNGKWLWDWRNIVTLAQAASTTKNQQRKFASAFHATVVQVIQDLTHHFRTNIVLLTGGVFQNAVLVSLCKRQLAAAGITVITHKLAPPGDGGLALGQVATLRRRGSNYVPWNSG